MSTLDLTKLPTLEDQGRDKLKMLLHGDPGTGKTTLATSIAELGPTLYLDLPGEYGSVAIPDSLRPSISVYKPRSIDEWNEVFWQLQSGEHDFQAVVIESLSALQGMYSRHVQGIPEGGPRKAARTTKRMDQRQLGGAVGEYLKDELVFWMGLADAAADKPLHVVMTSQSRYREVRKKTEDPNALGELLWTFIGPDVFPGIANTAEATPDYIGYLFLEPAEGDLSELAEVGAEQEPEWRYCVRFGPHALVRTKKREDIERAKKWPDVVGRDGKRLTLPKFMRFLGIA